MSPAIATTLCRAPHGLCTLSATVAVQVPVNPPPSAAPYHSRRRRPRPTVVVAVPICACTGAEDRSSAPSMRQFR